MSRCIAIGCKKEQLLISGGPLEAECSKIDSGSGIKIREGKTQPCQGSVAQRLERRRKGGEDVIEVEGKGGVRQEGGGRDGGWYGVGRTGRRGRNVKVETRGLLNAEWEQSIAYGAGEQETEARKTRLRGLMSSSRKL
ncbi:uncharacterized protein UDID_07359 [Ustilago sp. UG-2017a]|nr:uncharacterized protein UDID_07359 [Ustilago sp. UG-2017a]SPC64504.1 uncharacterized protein UHOD_07359 [Ustilago sp. UG-2017b]